MVKLEFVMDASTINNRLRKNGGTIIVVDHSDMIEQYFSKHIELTSDNGVLKDINQP